MKKIEHILDRRSIRRFTDQIIDNETIKQVLTAAMYAPSAVNLQPWVILKNRNQGRKVFIPKK